MHFFTCTEHLPAEAILSAVGTIREFTDAGCLMSYGENLPDVYRRAASYADKIFRGAKPGGLPVQQAVTFVLFDDMSQDPF